MAAQSSQDKEGHSIEEADPTQEAKNIKFQNACRIWFCPAEDKIAKELREMPQVQREKVWADLSGNEKTSLFKKEVDENETKMENCLKDMHDAIENASDKEALDLVAKKSPEFINNRAFQLMFLRSNEYDGKRAAQKLVEHMETKRRLFGEKLLDRDIRLSDLDADDLDTLNSGGIQFLKERDSAGRVILYGHVKNLKFKSHENLSRVLFYALMTTLRDESVQKLGAVVVWNIMSDYKGGYDYEADRMAIQTVGSLPIRLVARYVLFQSNLWNQVIEVLNYLISPELRVRSRSIQGDYGEVMYSLACLGIPQECIPTNKNGDLKLDNLQQWIREQKKFECRDHRESKKILNSRKRRRVCA